MLIEAGFFRSKKFYQVPASVQDLGITAIHAFDWGIADINTERALDYVTLNEMVEYARKLGGKEPIDHAWAVGLLWRLGESKQEIEGRWPYPVIRHGGKLWSRDCEARVFGALAFWQVQEVANALTNGDHESAINAVACAGMFLHFVGVAETEGNESLNFKDERRRGGKKKAENAKPNPEKAMAIECSRLHPELSATQIKTRAKLKASDRTIRGWLSEAC